MKVEMKLKSSFHRESRMVKQNMLSIHLHNEVEFSARSLRHVGIMAGIIR